MSNIIDTSYFINDLFIPLAVANPTSVASQATPNNNVALTDLITVVEKDLLLNALGLTAYNELQTALLDLPNADQKWKDLVNGVEYDGKIWEGLDNEKSLIAYCVYFGFLSNNSDFYMAMGTTKPNAENSTHTNPNYKLATSWQMFIKKYQGNCLTNPNIYYHLGVPVVDYFGDSNEIQVSLYQFLNDKVDDYGFDNTKFKTYRQKNSFGL